MLHMLCIVCFQTQRIHHWANHPTKFEYSFLGSLQSSRLHRLTEWAKRRKLMSFRMFENMDNVNTKNKNDLTE